MFITVRLLNGFYKPLTYKVPDAYQHETLVGRIVHVPLRTHMVYGLVQAQQAHLDHAVDFEIRALDSLHTFAYDEHFWPFIQKVAWYYRLDTGSLLRRLVHFLTEESSSSVVAPCLPPVQSKQQIQLTQPQQSVYEFVAQALEGGAYSPTLLHGVTGSGKTEVYKKLIERAHALGKTTIVLLPEISLALQFATHFRQTLPSDIVVCSFHSACSAKEKNQVWQWLQTNQPLVLVGVHLPALLPMSNLGLIIVDEEHEVGYQEKRHPKLNTKELALMRAQQYQIPILLGSATPSVSSLYQVQANKWHFFQLTDRYNGVFPAMRVVYLKKQGYGRKSFWISTELERAIAKRLEQHEQVILFLNRRGMCFFVQCASCAHIVYCQHCSVSMTLHADQQLRCHYCGACTAMPTACPQCKHATFIKKGIGTQQVVSIIQEMFPAARIARADLDVTSKKKVWQQTMADFASGAIDIMVGTQTITKGYHFPNVTLVGILWADINVHFPMFNAAETTLQQLIQVAGRSGRTGKPSEVIVQTMADHPMYQFLNERDYPTFCKTELAQRQVLHYPPCGRFVELELVHQDESVVERDAHVCAQVLRTHEQVAVLGPAKPMIAKIKNTHRRRIYLKAQTYELLVSAYKALPLKKLDSHVYFTPNPLS